jgi:two-component system, NarL family, nitrate/nitrite response regulator NarL
MLYDACLISPNEISRDGLSFILESKQFNIIGSFSRVGEVSTLLPDVLVVIDIPEVEDQLEAIVQLKMLCPTVKAVVLSERFDIKAMIDCFGAGAQGYIVKSMKSMPLITALRLAALGEKVLPSDLVEVLGRQMIEMPLAADIEHDIEDAKLSLREFDVLCCLMAGYSNKVIARQLEVCEATIKVHVKAILRKLKVRNRTQAAIWANSRGISENHLLA